MGRYEGTDALLLLRKLPQRQRRMVRRPPRLGASKTRDASTTPCLPTGCPRKVHDRRGAMVAQSGGEHTVPPGSSGRGDTGIPPGDRLVCVPRCRAPTRDSLANVAWCYYRLGQYDEALRKLMQALGLSPNDNSTQFDVALVLLCMRRGELALREYERAIEFACGHEVSRRFGIYQVALKDVAGAPRLDEGPERFDGIDWAERARGLLEGALERTACCSETWRSSRSGFVNPSRSSPPSESSGSTSTTSRSTPSSVKASLPPRWGTTAWLAGRRPGAAERRRGTRRSFSRCPVAACPGGVRPRRDGAAR